MCLLNRRSSVSVETTDNLSQMVDAKKLLTSLSRRSRLRSFKRDLAEDSRSPLSREKKTSAGYPKEKIRAPGSAFGRMSRSHKLPFLCVQGPSVISVSSDPMKSDYIQQIGFLSFNTTRIVSSWIE